MVKNIEDEQTKSHTTEPPKEDYSDKIDLLPSTRKLGWNKYHMEKMNGWNEYD